MDLTKPLPISAIAAYFTASKSTIQKVKVANGRKRSEWYVGFVLMNLGNMKDDPI